MLEYQGLDHNCATEAQDQQDQSIDLQYFVDLNFLLQPQRDWCIPSWARLADESYHKMQGT
jgi:lipopolysaccharide biosynthesis regulator YciM